MPVPEWPWSGSLRKLPCPRIQPPLRQLRPSDQGQQEQNGSRSRRPWSSSSASPKAPRQQEWIPHAWIRQTPQPLDEFLRRRGGKPLLFPCHGRRSPLFPGVSTISEAACFSLDPF